MATSLVLKSLGSMLEASFSATAKRQWWDLLHYVQSPDTLPVCWDDFRLKEIWFSWLIWGSDTAFQLAWGFCRPV